MPEKICPYCKDVFDANSLETESCRKTKCVKANQRAKKRLAAGVVEVKRGRPKSHVAALKERTIERIRKAQGPSSTQSASSDAVDSDVPPAFDPMVNALHPEKWNDQDRAHWQKVGEETIESLRKQSEHLEDATAGLPVDALPSRITQTQLKELRDKLVEDGKTSSHLPLAYCGGHKLPVEDSTIINQQAKAVISKVPTCKPGSELARLEKSQLKGKKKGGES